MRKQSRQSLRQRSNHIRLRTDDAVAKKANDRLWRKVAIRRKADFS
jgi:hypothetical protein